MMPSFYHAHHSNHMEDLPFWLGLARRTGSPVLELGCGTGRLLVPLAKAGLVVYGLDREAGWLAFLRANLEAERTLPSRSRVAGDPQAFVGPHVFVADMASFHLALEFSLIFTPCNILSSLSRPQRLATLACAQRHLGPGGLFAASLPNPAVLQRLPRRGEIELEEEFFVPENGDPVQVSSAWERSRDEFTLWWHYDHLFPDGRVERVTVKVRHSLADVTEYRHDLSRAGLQVGETYGDYDGAPYRENSPYWIFVASRDEGS